jgi:hypothetical protein
MLIFYLFSDLYAIWQTDCHRTHHICEMCMFQNVHCSYYNSVPILLCHIILHLQQLWDNKNWSGLRYGEIEIVAIDGSV